jgi:hypothetical protein
VKPTNRSLPADIFLFIPRVIDASVIIKQEFSSMALIWSHAKLLPAKSLSSSIQIPIQWVLGVKRP